MKDGIAKCVEVIDEVGPEFCDYSFDRARVKLFKKDGSVIIDAK